MSRVFEVVTPEQVAIRYELAGFGSRALAALLDSLFQLLLLIVVLVILTIVLDAQVGKIHSWETFAGSFLMGLFLIIIFLIFWGYHIFFETLWNGVTPGKRALGLQVIKDGGHPVDFRAVVIRNLLRAVDVLPGVPPILPLYGFALISVLGNDQYKRLGDLAAGTIVIRHGHDEEERRRALFGEAVVFRLFDAKSLGHVAQITREEHRLVQRFLEQRQALHLPLRSEFARRLATPLMEKISYRLPQLGIDYERWLDELDLAYRTHLYGAGATPAAPVTAPIVLSQQVSPPEPATEDDDRRKW